MHRILIVGTGSIGERHLRCFQGTGRGDVSFCEVNEALRTAISERYGVRGFASIEATEEETFDAAVICTPAHFHIPVATSLARRGIHLLIEKPLSTSLNGIPELQAEAKSRDIQIAVAYVLREHPGFGILRDVVDSKKHGRPVQFVLNSGQHFPTYRPAYRDTYYSNRATGGGAIQDAITHLLNAGEWLFGPIEELTCDAAHQVLDGVEVEDTVHVLTRHGSVMGCYSYNQHMAPNEMVGMLMCESGTTKVEFSAGRYSWMTEPGSEWETGEFDVPGRDDPFIRQANRFIDVIEGKAPPLCSLDEGLQTLRVNLAALKASDERLWVTI